MISKISNNLSFKNNLNNKQASGVSQDNQAYKKDFLQKHYDNLYKKNKVENDITTKGFGVAALTCFVGSLISKKPSIIKEWLAFGTISALITVVSYVFRPQKEKYDAQVQLDLNKEAANANSINK